MDNIIDKEQIDHWRARGLVRSLQATSHGGGTGVCPSSDLGHVRSDWEITSSERKLWRQRHFAQ